MKSIKKKAGNFFRGHRIRCGLNATAVVQHLGLSEAQLHDYEVGKNAIPLNLVFQMTNLYNIPPDEVVVLFYDLAHSLPRLTVVEKSGSR